MSPFNNRYKSIDDLPLILHAADLQRILGVSRSYSYALINSGAFPTITIGSRKLAKRESFLSWLESCEKTELEVK